MRVVQFMIPSVGRRVGFVDGNEVVDVTSSDPSLTNVYDVFEKSQSSDTSLDQTLSKAGNNAKVSLLNYAELLGASPGDKDPYLVAPFGHPDEHRVIVSGTGLTHTGSMQSRDQMHSDGEESSNSSPQEPVTDSAKKCHTACCT